MLLHDLQSQGLIHPPKWLLDNTQYLCVMGSTAYGVSSDSSDMDVYGITIPPKEDVFPHLRGEIFGFGTQIQRFNQWQEHHIKTLDGRREYDFCVYSIVRFFHLAMENNPNMVDALFVPERCILHCTQIGRMVRDARKTFLHKGSFSKYRGYSFAQLKKVDNKRSSSNSKKLIDLLSSHSLPNSLSIDAVREEMSRANKSPTGLEHLSDSELQTLFETMNSMTTRELDAVRHGGDVKSLYHVVRLALEAEQILMHHDLDLECNSEILKSIRRGEWTRERIESWFEEKSKALDVLYTTSSLREKPDEEAIKDLLLCCLEHHYGSLDKAIVRETDTDRVLRDMQAVIDQYT